MNEEELSDIINKITNMIESNNQKQDEDQSSSVSEISNTNQDSSSSSDVENRF